MTLKIKTKRARARSNRGARRCRRRPRARAVWRFRVPRICPTSACTDSLRACLYKRAAARAWVRRVFVWINGAYVRARLRRAQPLPCFTLRRGALRETRIDKKSTNPTRRTARHTLRTRCGVRAGGSCTPTRPQFRPDEIDYTLPSGLSIPANPIPVATLCPVSILVHYPTPNPPYNNITASPLPVTAYRNRCSVYSDPPI